MSWCKSDRTLAIAITFAMLVAVNSANAANISINFEGETLGSTTPPAGWSFVPVAGTSSYVVTAGNGGGLAGQVTGNHPSNSSTIPAGYMVNSGGVAFDATQPISGTFDFFIPEAGNYSSALFMIGDIQTGITQTTAGEWLGMFLRERTFGARAQLTAGDGSTLFNGDGNNQYRIDTNQWINADFTWTPTSGTTGDFSFEWTYPSQPNRGPMTVTGYTFASDEAWFGFGSGGYFNNDHSGRFDNISITGTEIVNFNMEATGSAGNWTIDNNGGQGEFIPAGSITPPATFGLNTLALEETATDLGSFDVEVTVTGDFTGGTETVAFNKLVTNSSDSNWADFLIELGTGLGDTFEASIGGDGLAFTTSPAATEDTGAFPSVLTLEDLLTYSGLLEIGEEASFSFAVEVPDLIDGQADGQAIFTLRQSAVATPEPASLTLWSLIGLCLTGFGYYRVRKKK